MKLLNMRKKIIIGNWKMNLDFESSNYLIQEIIKYVETPYGTKLVKWFFSEAIVNSKGQEISTIEVKKVLLNQLQSHCLFRVYFIYAYNKKY